jgi:hypothetical protein
MDSSSPEAIVRSRGDGVRSASHRWAKRQDLHVTSEVQPIRMIMVVRTVSAEEDEK